MARKTIVCIIGTRPEAIKMAPVVQQLRKSAWARCVVIATAQHRHLLDKMLARLNVGVDHDLDAMADSQTPSQLIARILPALDALLVHENAEVVLAQGDTVSVFAAAISAFHSNVHFGHVEAGLRTDDLRHPFPEERYRQMVARIACWHFAPTALAAANLLSEGVPSSCVYVSGNTGIDTLLSTVNALGPPARDSRRMILVTAHRRENFGAPFQNICRAMRVIVDSYPDIDINYPVHPNPSVDQAAHRYLDGHPRIRLIAPQDYLNPCRNDRISEISI